VGGVEGDGCLRGWAGWARVAPPGGLLVPPIYGIGVWTSPRRRPTPPFPGRVARVVKDPSTLAHYVSTDGIPLPLLCLCLHARAGSDPAPTQPRRFQQSHYGRTWLLGSDLLRVEAWHKITLTFPPQGPPVMAAFRNRQRPLAFHKLPTRPHRLRVPNPDKITLSIRLCLSNYFFSKNWAPKFFVGVWRLYVFFIIISIFSFIAGFWKIDNFSLFAETGNAVWVFLSAHRHQILPKIYS